MSRKKRKIEPLLNQPTTFEIEPFCDYCEYAQFFSPTKSICTRTKRVVRWCDTCKKYKHKEKTTGTRL